MKDSYAELVNLTIPPEEYSFNISCIYNQETFVVGNKAKVIMVPKLFIRTHSDRGNNEPISLKLLKNVKIKVEGSFKGSSLA